MPRIIDYNVVLEQLAPLGLLCVYHNSGAFAFEDHARAHSAGWIGPPDETIRPEARALAHHVHPPVEGNLTNLLSRAWREGIGGSAWLMPTNHWAYELNFGNDAWLPRELESIGIEAASLSGRTDAAAIEFAGEEAAPFERLVLRLLEQLSGSDFTIAFPARPVVARLHHHKQIWWTTTDAALIERLRAMV